MSILPILPIDEQWYDIRDERDEKDEKNKKNDDIQSRMKEMEIRMKEMDESVREMQKTINVMRTENLKLVNRVLEAEIALERAKNSLLRNHIPFPFASSPLHSKFKL